MVKRLQNQLKTISKNLVDLSKKVEKFSADLSKLEAKKAAPAKKSTPKKKAAPKKTAAKKTVKKPAKKTAKKPAKKAAKKTAKKPAKKASAAGKPTVLDSVYDVVKRSRKGVDIATLKKKTGLESRQLSNALYKLSKRGMIEAQSRGTYMKK